MKRRIIVEQLQELTEEQQQRLREWWKPQYQDVYAEYDGCLDCYEEMTATYPKQPDQNDLPLLDIGQMIELITDKQNSLCLVYYYGENAELHDTPGDYNYYPAKAEGKEICDCLWQAVKQVL